jgi:hypothetical protein
LSDLTIRRSKVPSSVTIPPAARTSPAASSAPRAIVSPTYGVRENGAFTTTVTVRRSSLEPPQPAVNTMRVPTSVTAPRTV